MCYVYKRVGSVGSDIQLLSFAGKWDKGSKRLIQTSSLIYIRGTRHGCRHAGPWRNISE